jgi:hypothetical protein
LIESKKINNNENDNNSKKYKINFDWQNCFIINKINDIYEIIKLIINYYYLN